MCSDSGRLADKSFTGISPFLEERQGVKGGKKNFPPGGNCPYIGIFWNFWKIFSVIWKKIHLLIFFKNFFFPRKILSENFTTKNLGSFRYCLGAKINPKSWWDFSETYGILAVRDCQSCTASKFPITIAIWWVFLKSTGDISTFSLSLYRNVNHIMRRSGDG